MVDTRDLKSLDASRAGSIPAPGILDNNYQIHKLFRMYKTILKLTNSKI